MITFEEIKKDPGIRTYIQKADESLINLGFTEHSFAHVGLVAANSKYILVTLGYTPREVELNQNRGLPPRHWQPGQPHRPFSERGGDGLPPAGPSAYGPLGHCRGGHCHWQPRRGDRYACRPMAAALILADKSDVRRSRVRNQDISKFDIHDRVNYSVTKAELKINENKTLIKLKLHIDTRYGSVMDYFEIFLNRMVLCRKAADTLGLQFKLIINEQQLI